MRTFWLIFAILYPTICLLLWCIIRSGSEHRKPTPAPPMPNGIERWAAQREQDDIDDLEKLYGR